MAKNSTQSKTADMSLLKNPRITEKAALANKYNIYLFDVAVGATKSEIAKAFESAYKQKPLRVNTVNLPRRSHFKQGKLGFSVKEKKAYIFLPKGVSIELM
jgi:large subunit ribosomal protein L23